MKKVLLFPLVFALLMVAVPAGAQANTDPDVASAQGNDPMPAGWSMRLDKPTASKATLRFVTMGPGLHVTSGPAAIYWNAVNTMSGPFTAEVTFTQTKAPTHAEAFGIIWAGKNLDAENQDYMYFIVRGDGKYMIKHRAGTVTHEIAPWTEHAGVAKQNAAGSAKTTLKVEATATGTKLYANGELVTELPLSGMTASTNGIVGLRVNHNLDVHVSGFSVTK